MRAKSCVLAFCLVLSAAAQQQSSPSSTKSSMPTMMIVAPLFLEDSKFSSTLSVVNASSEATYATVFVRSLSGGTILQKQLPLAPTSLVHVALRQLLDEAKSLETRGSIVVEQSPDLKGIVVLAQLSITYYGAGTSYVDEEFAMPDPTLDSSSLRAAGRSKDGSVLLSISSLSQSSQKIGIDCINRNAETFFDTITLAPNATLLVQACKQDTSTSPILSPNSSLFPDNLEEQGDGGQGIEAVGIQLVSNAGPGRFVAFGFSRLDTTGNLVLGGIPFGDPMLAASSSTVFAGVPVGAADLLTGGPYQPYASLANFSLRPAHVTIQYSTTSGAAHTSTVIAKQITLQPRRTTTILLADLQGDPGLRNSFIVSSDLAPGDLAASMASNVSDGEAEVELLGKDGQESENMGAHPWSIAEGDDSTLLLFNHTNQQQNTIVTVFSDKSPWRKQMKLAPFETAALSLGDLISNEIADDAGEVLSKDVVQGEIQWTMGQVGTITGRLLLSNKIAGMARTFSCQSYSVLCGASIVPTNTSLNVGAKTSFSLNYSSCLAFNLTACSGSSGGSVSPLYSWNWGGGLSASCGNSYVCSVTGTSPGPTTVTGTVYTNYCRLPATSNVTVKPSISGGNTVWWFNGQNPNSSSNPISVTLTSSGGSSTNWSVTQADTKVTLSSTSGAQITVTSTGTHFSGAVGDISIKATANGVASDPFTMTARTPWKMVLRSRNTTCFSSPQTYSTTISYDVHDNLDTLISSDIFWNETLSAAQCQNGSNWCNYQIISGGADSNPVQDLLEPPDLNTVPAPNPSPTCSGQGSGTTRYRAIPQTLRVGTNTTGAGVNVQSDTLGYYIDHGQHDSIQIPSQPPQ